ncbi:hypothetical protein V1511DRAFT_508173 [Dipodascopsis uninucleata]
MVKNLISAEIPNRNLFRGRVAVFGSSLSALFYERLWTERGGTTLHLPGLLSNNVQDRDDNSGNTLASGSSDWLEVANKAHYLFVEEEQWNARSYIDIRMIPFDPEWIVESIKLNKLASGNQWALWPDRIDPCHEPSSKHLQARRAPIDYRLSHSKFYNYMMGYYMNLVRWPVIQPVNNSYAIGVRCDSSEANAVNNGSNAKRYHRKDDLISYDQPAGKTLDDVNTLDEIVPSFNDEQNIEDQMTVGIREMENTTGSKKGSTSLSHDDLETEADITLVAESPDSVWQRNDKDFCSVSKEECHIMSPTPSISKPDGLVMTQNVPSEVKRIKRGQSDDSLIIPTTASEASPMKRIKRERVYRTRHSSPALKYPNYPKIKREIL